MFYGGGAGGAVGKFARDFVFLLFMQSESCRGERTPWPADGLQESIRFIEQLIFDHSEEAEGARQPGVMEAHFSAEFYVPAHLRRHYLFFNQQFHELLCDFGCKANLMQVLALGQEVGREHSAMHAARTRALLLQVLKTENDRAALDFILFAHRGDTAATTSPRRMYDDVRAKLAQVFRPALSESIEEHRSFLPRFIAELYAVSSHSNVNLKFRQFLRVFSRYCRSTFSDGARRFLGRLDVHNACCFCRCAGSGDAAAYLPHLWWLFEDLGADLQERAAFARQLYVLKNRHRQHEGAVLEHQFRSEQEVQQFLLNMDSAEYIRELVVAARRAIRSDLDRQRWADISLQISSRGNGNLEALMSVENAALEVFFLLAAERQVDERLAEAVFRYIY